LVAGLTFETEGLGETPKALTVRKDDAMRRREVSFIVFFGYSRVYYYDTNTSDFDECWCQLSTASEKIRTPTTTDRRLNVRKLKLRAGDLPQPSNFKRD
jgi:hypothetical protein